MTVMSVDRGYWTGSITYSPSWAPAPLTISFGTGPDANGNAWIIEKLEGWDSPDIVGQVLQRGADHGGWAAGQWYAPRAMTLQVRASCPTQAARDIARAQMQMVCPPGDLALFKYNEPIPKQVWFRRAGKVTETYDNLQEVDFACVLICPDPRKYSQTLKTWSAALRAPTSYLIVGTSGSPGVAAFNLANNTNYNASSSVNAGNFETRPTVTIQGPLHYPAVTYVNTGQMVSWSTLILNTGDVLTIDFDSRTGWVNAGFLLDVPLRKIPGPVGTFASHQIAGGYFPADISSQWFTLWPGVNALQLTAPTSATTPAGTDRGSMQVMHRDAWI
jgi:hypothetical protein